MHEQDRAILESLVSVAWADGTFDAKERELLEGLLEAFGASEDEAKEVREYAEQKRTLEDVPLTELSFEDRRALLQHAVLLSWVDGEQHETEKAFLEQLRHKLNIPEEEAAPLVEGATTRAKRLLEAMASE
jgi:tellurite resistance protein